MYISGEIAERVKALTKTRGITLGNLLRDAGLGNNTMANFKTSMPKCDTLAKIADVLNCSVDYLLGRSEEPDVAPPSYERLSDEEQELIEYFRHSDKSGRRRLLVLGEDEASRADSERKTGDVKIG